MTDGVLLLYYHSWRPMLHRCRWCWNTKKQAEAMAHWTNHVNKVLLLVKRRW